MRVGEEELAPLGVAQKLVVEVGEGYHRAPAHPTRDHALAYLADDIMHIDGAEPPTLPGEDAFAREGEQGAQWLGAGGLAAHSLQARTGWPDEGEVEGDILPRVPRLEAERERVAPTLLRVGDDVRRELHTRLRHDLRQLLDRGALHRVAHARAAHGDVHYLGKVLELRRRDVGTVVCTHITDARGLARELHEPHRGH